MADDRFSKTARYFDDRIDGIEETLASIVERLERIESEVDNIPSVTEARISTEIDNLGRMLERALRLRLVKSHPEDG
jgi:archaellum component FlaC